MYVTEMVCTMKNSGRDSAHNVYMHIARHIMNMYTSGMLSIVGEWVSAHAKLEARTALRYEQCGIHIYINI